MINSEVRLPMYTIVGIFVSYDVTRQGKGKGKKEYALINVHGSYADDAF